MMNSMPHQTVASKQFYFTVMDSVFAKLANLAVMNTAEQISLRISIDGGGCAGFSYKYELIDDCGNSDDFVVHNKTQINSDIIDIYVVIDPISQPFISGAKLDFVTTLTGSQFEIINPNAKARCGCGNSFNSNVAAF